MRTKICIICYSARKIAPYLQFYIDYFSDKEVDFVFITREIDRNHLDTEILSNQYVIENYHTNSILGKIANIFKWKKNVIRILKKNNYDKLVLLTGYPTLILSKYIIKNFNKKYIVDIRDYMPLFGYKIINKILFKALNNAAFVVISSDGFRSWLPQTENIYTVHNCPQKNITNKGFSIVDSSVKRIGYLGVISYIENNTKLIDYFCNEHDFSLFYAGVYDNSASLQKHVNEHGIKNVTFQGAFNNCEKEALYDNVDMINAIYGNDSLIVTSALPNKLYDAILYKKPILVSKNTYLAKIVEEYNLGISVDMNSNPVDEIRNYIRNFNQDLFLSGAIKLLDKCQNDNSLVFKMLDQFAGE